MLRTKAVCLQSIIWILIPHILRNSTRQTSTINSVISRSIIKCFSQFFDVSVFLADGTFICPVNNFSKSYSLVNPNVYMYHFERKLNRKYLDIDQDVVGVCHISPLIPTTSCMLRLNGSSPNFSVVDVKDKRFFIDATKMIPTSQGPMDPQYSVECSGCDSGRANVSSYLLSTPM